MKIEEAQAKAQEILDAVKRVNELVKATDLNVDLEVTTHGDKNTPIIQATCTVDPKNIEP